jgi:rootletin
MEREREDGPESLARQNQDLRRRLEEEAANYRRRLDTYRQAQRHQATLVSRLQAKVLQYKKRCAELESHMEDEAVTGGPESLGRGYPTPGSALDTAHQHLREMRDRDERIHDLETALRRLEEERRK